MARFSTNALTARYCALLDWPSETVQSFSGDRRHDLFGIVDTVVLGPNEEIWIQNCSYGSRNDHRAKIDASPYLEHLDRYKRLLGLWEWRRRKVGRRKLWFLRMQYREGGVWEEPGEWIGPLDLYPRKNSKPIEVLL